MICLSIISLIFLFLGPFQAYLEKAFVWACNETFYVCHVSGLGHCWLKYFPVALFITPAVVYHWFPGCAVACFSPLGFPLADAAFCSIPGS